jgi:L-alanine-DL-glutamate epimerase-like enolase superfamily enzyme
VRPLPIRLRLETLGLRLKHSFTISRSSSTSKTNVLVRATAGDHEGLGEASHTTRYGQDTATVRDALERALPELDGRETSPRALRERVLRLALPSGARMGLSIALADLEARMAGVPLHALLGVPAPVPLVTSFTVGLDTREAMVAKAREAACFPVLKVKAGRPDDLDLVAAVRAVHPGTLRVDANEGWTPDEAPGRIAALARMSVELVEQPIAAGQLEHLARIVRSSPIPILVDEDLVTGDELPGLAGRVAGVNVKLMKCGSLERAVEIMVRARSLGLKVMIGCMIESSVAVTAAAHLLALADFADLDGNLLVTNDPFRGVAVEGGRLVVPADRPGLGVVRAAAPDAGTP